MVSPARLFAAVLGIAVFLAILWWAATTHARLWRRLASRYRAPRTSSSGKRRLETIVITHREASGPRSAGVANFRQYAGTILGVSATGMSFSTIAPLGPFCPAFAVPFEALELHRTSWAMWPEPFALRLRDQPDTDIILARETVQWIRSQTDRAPFGE